MEFLSFIYKVSALQTASNKRLGKKHKCDVCMIYLQFPRDNNFRTSSMGFQWHETDLHDRLIEKVANATDE